MATLDTVNVECVQTIKVCSHAVRVTHATILILNLLTPWQLFYHIKIITIVGAALQ